MNAWISRDGSTYGPYTVEQLGDWLRDGTVARDELACMDGGAWTTVGELLAAPATRAIGPSVLTSGAADEQTLRRIADYERISAIVWAVIAAVQILSVVGIVAGAWNAYAAWTRFQLVPHITGRNSAVPDAFESINGLVIIGLINLFLGGVFGVVGVIMDFVVRDIVLKNRHLFDCENEAELPV